MLADLKLWALDFTPFPPLLPLPAADSEAAWVRTSCKLRDESAAITVFVCSAILSTHRLRFNCSRSTLTLIDAPC